uniref:Uncharacterized protein n=1 Tax=Rhizophora mucronata TaxID=61149 RepID=A0A2P2PAI4_RHIMU
MVEICLLFFVGLWTAQQVSYFTNLNKEIVCVTLR